MPAPAFITTSWNAPPLTIIWCALVVLLRLIQPSSVNESPTSRLLESGTRTLSSTPSSVTAVLLMPAAPSSAPPRYVPWLADGDESFAVVPVSSSKRQQPRACSAVAQDSNDGRIVRPLITAAPVPIVPTAVAVPVARLIVYSRVSESALFVSAAKAVPPGSTSKPPSAAAPRVNPSGPRSVTVPVFGLGVAFTPPIRASELVARLIAYRVVCVVPAKLRS